MKREAFQRTPATTEHFGLLPLMDRTRLAIAGIAKQLESGLSKLPQRQITHRGTGLLLTKHVMLIPDTYRQPIVATDLVPLTAFTRSSGHGLRGRINERWVGLELRRQQPDGSLDDTRITAQLSTFGHTLQTNGTTLDSLLATRGGTNIDAVQLRAEYATRFQQGIAEASLVAGGLAQLHGIRSGQYQLAPLYEDWRAIIPDATAANDDQLSGVWTLSNVSERAEAILPKQTTR